VKETSDTASGVACNTTGERKSGEKSGRHAVDEGKKQAIQRAAWQVSRRREETNDTVGAAAGKTSTRERNKWISERRGGQDVDKRMKQAAQRAARRATRRRVKVTSDTASGGQHVDRWKKQAIQQVVRLASCRQGKETSNTVCGTAGKLSDGYPELSRR
jgi:hypothetical protein